MNHHNIPYVISIFIAITATHGVASARTAQQHLYANSISAHNIAVIQHSITNNAFQSFEGTASAALGNRAEITLPAISKIIPTAGHNAPSHQYGTAAEYGEYGGDTGNIYGRSGGDGIYALPTVNNIWAHWNAFGGNAALRGVSDLDSDYNLISIGTSVGRTQLGDGVYELGAHAGFVGGTQENTSVTINENGGYFGIYGGYKLRQLSISAAINMGALSNTAENNYGDDEYANMWAGATTRIGYNMAIGNTFTLQPSIYAGFTWVKSANYISESGQRVSNDNFNFFEITPGLRAIKHITNGWFGIIDAKYVFIPQNGGSASATGIELRRDRFQHFAEYGIGIEKSIDRFNISVTINRRDGDRDGWNGGAEIKYLF